MKIDLKELGKRIKLTRKGQDLTQEMLAEKAMQDPCKPGNPREVSKEEFVELFRRAAE